MKKNFFSTILCVCFLTVLVIPSLHIDFKTQDSASENRRLAAFPPLIAGGSLNLGFGKQFENWFNDRFFCRETLLKLLAKSHVNDIFRHGNKMVLAGKDGWYFERSDNGMENYMNIDDWSAEQVQAVTVFIDSFDKWCKKNNKKFIFFIAPDKMRVYGEYYPDFCHKYRPDSESKTQHLLKYMREHTDAEIIYPLEELLSKKTDENISYFKTDTHWNNYGGYIGYEVINDVLGEPYKSRKIFPSWKKAVCPKGDFSIVYPEGVKDDPTEYNIAVYDYTYTEKSNAENNGPLSYNTDCPDGEGTIVFFRDSFTIAMHPYFSQQFAHVEDNWRRDVRTSDLAYIKEHGDVVIYEVIERYIKYVAEQTFPQEP